MSKIIDTTFALIAVALITLFAALLIGVAVSQFAGIVGVYVAMFFVATVTVFVVSETVRSFK